MVLGSSLVDPVSLIVSASVGRGGGYWICGIAVLPYF